MGYAHSAFRSRIVPEPAAEPLASSVPPAPGDQLEHFAKDVAAQAPSRRHRWAWLLAHVFAADLETCPSCGAAMRFAEVARTENAARRLIAKLGLVPRSPPTMPAPSPGQLNLPFVN